MINNKQECDQCSGTELVQHEGAKDWMLCMQCGNSTKIEKVEWECSNEMRWYQTKEKDFISLDGTHKIRGMTKTTLQQKWTDQWCNEKWVNVPTVSE